MKVIIKSTGEIITIDQDTTLLGLSTARKELVIEMKELERQIKEVDTLLTPHLETALENGEDTLADFWKIQRGARRFDRALFEEKADIRTIATYAKARETVQEIEEEYRVHGKPFLKFPRL